MPRLSRKMPRRQFDAGRPPASADLYEGLQSATPVTQIDPEVSKAPRLSRKTPRRQFDPGRPPASADLYEGPETTTPVLCCVVLCCVLCCVLCVVCCVVLCCVVLRCVVWCCVVLRCVGVVVVLLRRTGGGRMRMVSARGVRNKNKNPTTQCGEKQINIPIFSGESDDDCEDCPRELWFGQGSVNKSHK